jgi:hypothetical protein
MPAKDFLLEENMFAWKDVGYTQKNYQLWMRLP